MNKSVTDNTGSTSKRMLTAVTTQISLADGVTLVKYKILDANTGSPVEHKFLLVDKITQVRIYRYTGSIVDIDYRETICNKQTVQEALDYLDNIVFNVRDSSK